MSAHFEVLKATISTLELDRGREGCLGLASVGQTPLVGPGWTRSTLIRGPTWPWKVFTAFVIILSLEGENLATIYASRGEKGERNR